MVVAHRPSRRWWLWSSIELVSSIKLVLATELRTVRSLATSTSRLKAKVLLDPTEAGFLVDSPTAATRPSGGIAWPTVTGQPRALAHG